MCLRGAGPLRPGRDVHPPGRMHGGRCYYIIRCIILYHIISHYIILYYSVLYYIILYYIISYYIML